MTDTTTWDKTENHVEIADWSVHSNVESYGEREHVWGDLPQYAAKWLLAMIASTTPLNFYDPSRDFHRSQTSSVVSPFRRRSRRSITITQARQLALRVLAQANEYLASERAEESRLLLISWNDEDFS